MFEDNISFFFVFEWLNVNEWWFKNNDYFWFRDVGGEKVIEVNNFGIV